MSDTTALPTPPPSQELETGSSRIFLGLFGLILVIGMVYAGVHLGEDLSVVRSPSELPYVLLGIALIIALGFEFVNGFHDTANAVATVIYTNAMHANLAVIWSGIFNFLGVLTSTGGVAFTIVSLLPVELILKVGSAAGFAMVFALLIAAILWNLLTWYVGIPNSSSHTLIGSILGVGFNRQAAPHLRARPLRRSRGHGADPGRHGLSPADEHHPCAYLRRRRYDGGERLGSAMDDNS
jgi:PiT family inorganic phosphate transporter